ncbi:MAG: DUF3320 domain-containing protein [Aquimonas sp.]|nr:DUF3320 domain-containing protein [Aquimonas sp.]
MKPRTWRLDSVGAGETFHLKDLDIQLDGTLLSRLTEAEPATLSFELHSAEASNAPLTTYSHSLELLARNQWGGIAYLPEMVAAFVQPNDPAIDRLLKSAALALQESGQSGAINGYGDGAKRAWELASGIWTAVLKRKLNYTLPPASFEMTGQKVRSPSQALDSGLATCLDLTLLFAACLEQAGLNPLLIFTRGHAFVGVWLRDEEFSFAVVDDITALRKRLKLQELVVFETTLATSAQPAGFSQAIAQGNRQLSEEEEDAFELAVDVRRARMSRIKPLALASAAPTLSVPAEALPEPILTVEAAPDLPDEVVSEVPAAALDPKDRLARWQRKLLDLSLRNALLNFKQGKRALVLEADAAALEDALAEGQTLRLLPMPEVMQGGDPRSQQLHESRTSEDLRRAHAADALKRKDVFVRLDERDLDGRLVELFRGARTAMQEGGANTLFVALGFLVWSRADKPEARIKAPLILMPVTLERKSARSGFTLLAHEDESRFNPTLVEMLRQDFQLDLGVPLGELPRDDSGLDIAGIWKRVRAAIRDIRGWELSEDVVLSMFSFAKYLMWKDLSERTDDLRKSPVVAHLLDTPREPYPSSIAFPDAHTLDRDYTPDKVFSPLPADSSQLSAVMAAAKGKDFVLIGPPGTGKSQTIANLIAQCLADGKRVLFVAEKIAALDVVHRRLREVGLSEFCLELHSSKSRKLDVLSQLQTSWQAKGIDASTVWAAKAQQLSRLREQLSSYVERLHFRHRNGWTIFRAIGSVVGGSALPDLRFRWPSPESHDEAAYASLRELATRLQANASAIGQQDLAAGPLTPVHVTEWSARWQQELVQAAQTLRGAADALAATLSALGSQLDIEWPELGYRARSSLGILSKALPQAAAQDWSFCAAADSERLCSSLKSAAEQLAQHRDLSTRMAAPWSPELQAQLGQAIALLEQRQRVHAELGTPWPVAVRAEVERGVQCIEEIARLREGLSVRYGSGVAPLNVAQLQRDWDKADKSFWPMSWLGKRRVRKALDGVIEGTGEPRVAEDLDALVRIRSLGSEVEQINPGAAVEGVWAGLKTRADDARSALAANAALLAARTQRPFNTKGLDAALEGGCGERWVTEAQRLKALAQQDRQLADCAALAEPSHGLWRGLTTDTAELRAAMEFERERLGLSQRGALQNAHDAVADGRCGAALQAQHALLIQRATLEAQLLGLSELHSRCPAVWSGLDTDLDNLARALRFRALLQAGLNGLGASAATAMQALFGVLAHRREALAETGEIGRLCSRLPAQLADLNAALEGFGTLAAQPDTERAALKERSAEAVSTMAAQLEGAHPGLRAWCGWRVVQQQAAAAGLDALAKAIEAGDVDAAQAPQAFETNYARWWLGEAVDADEVLKRFVSAEHEQRIADFRALDDEFTRITRQLIRARLCADLPSVENISRNSEWGVLRHEMAKKRAHKPLRQLLQEIPSVVLKLAPCLLMSPLSIAQYLSADASNFDLVVFDEASQIPVWDAIGAMARAKQVVMVGDPKQLPPTNFFDRADSSELDSDDVEGDLESILDECLGASLPTRNLSWHYRSRHESLIAFSNHRYYNSGLVTFPSPVTDDRAVSFHFVEGTYEKGGARINQPEAKALVADLVGRLKSAGFRESGLTIGVVTFNSEQQRLIEDLLDAERRIDPALESYFSEMLLEPVFVKNLESVQGDERDIMYFSITYGPNTAGVLSMNFGPLNRSGGERRLNVAITRARHELRVFASLRGEQMDLSRTQALGVRDLKHFLEFAERGPRALAEAHHCSQGDFDSPFEVSVCAALQRKGWQVHAQIGASQFRVDLGVVHPDFAGRYLAGIECDGATYHRSATARDRDKLREQVLRGLGWEILRLWSTDWWVNPGGTLERIHTRLNQLLQEDRGQRALAQRAEEQAARERAAQELAAEQLAADEQATRERAEAEQASGEQVAERQTGNEPMVSELRSAGSDDANAARSQIETDRLTPLAAAARQIDAGTSDFDTNNAARAATAQEQAVYADSVEHASAPPPSGAAQAQAQSDRPRFAPSNPAEAVPEGALSAERFFDPDYDSVLTAMIEHVVQHEGPVLDSVLARRIARGHGFQRTGSRIQERVVQITQRLFNATEEVGGTFYWPRGLKTGSDVVYRWPADDDVARAVGEICIQELASLAHWVLDSGRTEEVAVIAMAREIGLQQLRAASRERLMAAIAVITG